jgi:1,4-alpha-glucan branching enzyme
MVTRGDKKGTIRFTCKAPQTAKEVMLAGEFSGWQGRKMARSKDGAYVAVVPLQAGTYEYKFIVDGQWQADPENPLYGINPFGTPNSVVAVD